MEEEKIDYYKIAVDWGKNYLLNRKAINKKG
jgi:hypothetical protein